MGRPRPALLGRGRARRERVRSAHPPVTFVPAPPTPRLSEAPRVCAAGERAGAAPGPDRRPGRRQGGHGGSDPPMSPTSPSPGISGPPPPPPGSRSRPSAPPSILPTSCPAQAGRPIRPVNRASTVPPRARSSAGATTTVAVRRDRRKNHDSSSAPTRLTPSGVISMAMCASAPWSPNADTSPDGMTAPPAPSATTAAVIGPHEPAVSAPRRCRPSAAVPAIPANPQLTAAIADNRTFPRGTSPPSRAPSPFAAESMADPPIRAAACAALVSLVGDYHSPARFSPRQRQRPRRP